MIPVFLSRESPAGSPDAENVIAVRVDNSRHINSRWYSGSGIYRPVRLIVTDRVHVGRWGVTVTTPEVSPVTLKSSRIDVPLDIQPEGKTVTLRSGSDIRSCSVYDLAGRLVNVQSSKSTGAEIRITLPRPGMYILHVSTEDGDQVRKVAVK